MEEEDICKLHATERWSSGWRVEPPAETDWEVVLGSNWNYISFHTQESMSGETKENHEKNSVRIAGLLVEIWTQDLPNKKC
jgi:hypothetical protein